MMAHKKICPHPKARNCLYPYVRVLTDVIKDLEMRKSF
jgi:hypothetical protein